MPYLLTNQNSLLAASVAPQPMRQSPNKYNRTSYTTVAAALSTASSAKNKSKPALMTLILFIEVFIILFGIFGNTLVIYLVSTRNKLRNVRNAFMLNLTVSNLLLLTICMPSYLITVHYSHWIFGEVLCKILHAAPIVIILVSSFSIMAIAVDRWMFIVFARSRQLGSRDVLVVIAGIWLSAIMLSVPVFNHRFIQNLDNQPFMEKLKEICATIGSLKHFSLELFLNFQLNNNNNAFTLPSSLTLASSSFKKSSSLSTYLTTKTTTTTTIITKILNSINSSSSAAAPSSASVDAAAAAGFDCDILNKIEKNHFKLKNDENIAQSKYCIEVWPNLKYKRIYIISLFVLEFVLPSLCMLVTYIWIIRFLKNHDARMSHYEQLRKMLIQKERPHQKNCKLLTSMCLTFIVCYLPLSLFNIKSDFESANLMLNNLEENDPVEPLSLWSSIESLNAVLSPLLYGWMNQNFRVEINKMFTNLRALGKRYQKVRQHNINNNNTNSNNINLTQSAINNNTKKINNTYKTVTTQVVVSTI